MNKFSKKIIFLALFLFSVSFAFSETVVKFNSLNDKIPSDPKVKIGKLDNGLTFYIKENKKPENRAELHLVVYTGSVQEDNDQLGLAHFIEHMCFNGTKNFPKNDLISFLESTGMRFGADINASTGFDRTHYFLQIPMDKPEILDKSFQVLEDWAHNVSFDQDELDKERGVILEEWRLYRGAQDRLMKQHFPYLLKGSKYADRDVIGDTAIILHAPRETFLRYYKDWYRPDLMAVIAVGDFNAADMEKKIKEHFSNLKPVVNPRPREKYHLPPHNEILASIAKEKELTYPMVNVIIKSDSRDETIFATYRQNMVESLIDQMLNMRLAELTKKPKPPFFMGLANQGRFIGESRALTLIGITKTDDMTSGLDALLEESIRAQKFGFNESELDRAKKELMKSIEKSYAERDKTPSSAYAQEFARNFEFGEAMPGIEYELEMYKKFLPEISLKEVNETTKKAIKNENMVILVSGQDKPEAKIPTKEETLALYDVVSKRDIKPYVDKTTDKPLFGKKVTPGTIKSEKEIKELGITELTLSNGAKVILKPTDFKNDEILFRAYSLGGTSLVSDKDFVSANSSTGVIDEAGIADFDAITLEKMLSGKNVSISPMISELTEGFRGSTTPNDLETLFQLIHLYFTDPRKDTESYNTYLNRTKELMANAKNDPRQVFRDTIQYVMNSYNFRKRPWQESMINELDLDKIYKIYKERFADAGDFVYIFVGNFKFDEMKNMINKYIANLPGLNSKEKFKDLGIKPPKGQVKKQVKKGIEKQSSVNIVLTGDFDYNSENEFLLKSMIELFSIRLREVIREDKSGVYGIEIGRAHV